MHPVRRASEGSRGRADVGQQEHGYRLFVSALLPEAVKRYVRASSDPVACFLVVAADADDSAKDSGLG